MSPRRLPFLFFLAVVVSAGATAGLGADSPADARMSPAEFDIDTDSAVNGGGYSAQKSALIQDVVDGALAFVLVYLNEIAVWSFHHPAIASTVLLHLPWILVGAVVIRWSLLGALVAYAAVGEYRARREGAGDGTRVERAQMMGPDWPVLGLIVLAILAYVGFQVVSGLV